MKKEEKIEKYRQILETLKQMKTAVVNDATTELMLSGALPETSQGELKVLSGVESSVFCALKTLGVPVLEESDRPGVVTVELGDASYHCALKNLNVLIDLSKQQLSATEVWGAIGEQSDAPARGAAPIPEPEPEPTPEPQPEPEPEPITEEEAASPVIEVAPPAPEDEEPETEAEVPVEASPFEEEISLEEETPAEKPSETLFEMDESKEFGEKAPVEEAPVEKELEAFKALGGKVIGGGNSSGIAKDDFFLDENRKAGSEFIYSFVKMSVMHTDGGGRPEEMLAMVAPLKIYKHAQSNVPIVVALYSKKNGVTSIASSYLTQAQGRNMVQIELAQYYFLVKGSFDDSGNFVPMINTTGISAQAGDKISVIEQKNYGNALDRNTKNGHVKFHAQTDEGPGYIEVFPFGKIEDETDGSGDFVAIVKNDEFATPYFVSNSLRGNSSVIIYQQEGVPSELICKWEDGDLVAGLEERGRKK